MRPLFLLLLKLRFLPDAPLGRFLKLSQNGHRMPISALQTLPELKGNPFVTHIVKLYDRDNDDMVSLEEFIMALKDFRSLSSPEEKLKRAEQPTPPTHATDLLQCPAAPVGPPRIPSCCASC